MSFGKLVNPVRSCRKKYAPPAAMPTAATASADFVFHAVAAGRRSDGGAARFSIAPQASKKPVRRSEAVITKLALFLESFRDDTFQLDGDFAGLIARVGLAPCSRTFCVAPALRRGNPRGQIPLVPAGAYAGHGWSTVPNSRIADLRNSAAGRDPPENASTRRS